MTDPVPRPAAAAGPEDAAVGADTAADAGGPAGAAAPIVSPCVSRCGIDPRDGLCRGCARTLDEITRWRTLDDVARAAVMAGLADRRRARGG